MNIKTIMMWMPLVDIDADIVTFASGSRKKGSVFKYEISDMSEE